MEEFTEITDELSELEHRIRLKGELCSLMSAMRRKTVQLHYCARRP
jgi:hypothetical protein